MRNLLMAAAVGGTALLSGYGTAAAQIAIQVPGAGLYIGPSYDDDDDDYSQRPRHYRSYRYSGDSYSGERYRGDSYRERRRLQSDFAACGRNSYSNGDSCHPGGRP